MANTKVRVLGTRFQAQGKCEARVLAAGIKVPLLVDWCTLVVGLLDCASMWGLLQTHRASCGCLPLVNQPKSTIVTYQHIVLKKQLVPNALATCCRRFRAASAGASSWQAGECQNHLPAPWREAGGACGGGAAVSKDAGGPRARALLCRRGHGEAHGTPGVLHSFHMAGGTH